MRSFRLIAAGVVGAIALIVLTAATYVATANYMASGSDWEIGSVLNVTGTQTVQSGGVLNVASGGAIQVAGADKTTALAAAVTNPTAGVAAGYKIAQGETALGGTNPTAVTTGLTTITACVTTIKLTTAPGVGTSVITYGSSSGTLNLYGWKVTNSSTTTLVASTGTETIGWACWGT